MNKIFRILFEPIRLLCIGVFYLAGWRVEGALPRKGKFVVIAAPHTSNWDFVWMLGCAMVFNVRIHWLGKHTLFNPPWGWFMRLCGGIPVDRRKSNNVVEQMVAVYESAENLSIAIPPEGTRAKVRYWKTGFYHIAHGAGVPIALGFLDYSRKVGGIGPLMITTGNYDRDLEEIKKFYAGIKGRVHRNEFGKKL
ncbi:MAG: glycerol acyltransferase [Marinicaulis sp.]|nr:glycerol acyltransferase [Marinicaulis sp.]NNL88502.1 glycerol acyltransferase [Marinicaulis sp.]